LKFSGYGIIIKYSGNYFVNLVKVCACDQFHEQFGFSDTKYYVYKEIWRDGLYNDIHFKDLAQAINSLEALKDITIICSKEMKLDDKNK
jgi:hypothetical protein